MYANGERDGTDLEVGYTRLISFKNIVPLNNIQSYYWVSSNPIVATISQYGTITAYNSGTTVISYVYTLNNLYKGQITIEVY